MNKTQWETIALVCCGIFVGAVAVLTYLDIQQSAAAQWENTTSWASNQTMQAIAQNIAYQYNVSRANSGGVYSTVGFMGLDWIPAQDCAAILRNFTEVSA